MPIFYFLYSVITGVGVVLLSPYLAAKDLLRGDRRKKHLETLPERLGWRLPAGLSPQRAQDRRTLGTPELAARNGSTNGNAGTIWVHAVSVGEALAAVPLGRLLKQRFPERRLVVSTTTATGQALARERMRFADAVFFFPLDWRGPVRRALRAVDPALVIVMETEIWPNFLREARREGVPVLFVNARISERSFGKFSRSLRMTGGLLRGFLREVLRDATLYLTQSAGDSERLIELGAPAERVIVAGNMKYDLAAPETNALATWLAAEMAAAGRGPLVVAGSVIAGEEAPVLEALAAVEARRPGVLLVLAPRKPERFAEAAALMAKSGRPVVRRSELKLAALQAAAPAGGAGEPAMGGEARSSSGALGVPRSVLLLDTIGELAALYRLADAVFVGGSLEPAGGHNPLEPAAAGKPPVFGPSMENFRDIAAALVAADAAIEVRSGAELGSAWNAFIADPARGARMGRAAREIVERNRGATAVALEWAAKLLEQTAVPAEERARA